VHGLSSLQLIIVPPPHVTPWQVWPTTQRFPVPQLPITGECGQDGGFVMQFGVSEVQGLPSSQFKPDDGRHTRGVSGFMSWFVQTKPVAHRVSGAHMAPSARSACWQPDIGSQLSVVHGLPSSQLTAVPAQLPFEQLSGFVQALPSLQVPAMATCVQPSSELQASMVQTF